MAKHAVNPDTPTSDCERLRQAEHIVKASIVANDVSHPLEISLSHTLEAAHCLIQDVIEHLGEGSKRKRPGELPTSVTGRLLQAAGILKVCIVANTDGYIEGGGEFDFSYPMHAAVALIDEAHNRLYEGKGQATPARAAGRVQATEGKPN
jgi:hypothetical protein